MGLLKLFKKKDKTAGSSGAANSKNTPANKGFVKNTGITITTNSNANTSAIPADKRDFSTTTAQSVPASTTSSQTQNSSFTKNIKRDKSFKRLSALSKSSFSNDSNVPINKSNADIISNKDLPEELLPVVTLINHQQSRTYFKGACYFFDSSTTDTIPPPHEANPNSFPDPAATNRRVTSTSGFNNKNDPSSFNWIPAFVELNGNDITVDSEDGPPVVINVCDCELTYDKENIMLIITITNQSLMYFQFDSIDELNTFYSALLLCKFEYQQLQEAYTGALLSSQAIHFSDIRTLLAPTNKNVKEEWCVIRFPFLNDKWIRCCVVVLPNNKIEIYTHSSKSKKYLLATIKNGLNSYTIYPNDPSQIQNNSLLRLYGNCYINSELLNDILNDDSMSSTDENISLKGKKNGRRSRSGSKSRSRSNSQANSISTNTHVNMNNMNNNNNSTTNTSRSRSRTNSLSKRLSMASIRSSHSRESSVVDNNSNFSSPLNNLPHNNTSSTHQRISSVDTTISETSFSNSKTPKKLSKKSIARTHLIYIIPESHASVKPCEILLRLLIPILNSYKLYGRPHKFISSRTDKNSLLFGLPQLPNTYYLNEKSSLDLVNLNIENSLKENWTAYDWNTIYKELLSALLSKGWKGGSYEGDLVNMNFSLNSRSPTQLDFDEDGYDPMDDFIAAASSSVHKSVSINE